LIFAAIMRRPSSSNIGWLLAFILMGCGVQEFSLQRKKIEPLVRARASKEQVSEVLGTNYNYYSKGASNWIVLQQRLTLDTSRDVEVRQALTKWPHAMFYSTPDMTTWVFLDENERAADFHIGTQ
jgi:hypothetical protein